MAAQHLRRRPASRFPFKVAPLLFFIVLVTVVHTRPVHFLHFLFFPCPAPLPSFLVPHTFPLTPTPILTCTVPVTRSARPLSRDFHTAIFPFLPGSLAPWLPVPRPSTASRFTPVVPQLRLLPHVRYVRSPCRCYRLLSLHLCIPAVAFPLFSYAITSLHTE
jgi:hypothetical protein